MTRDGWIYFNDLSEMGADGVQDVMALLVAATTFAEGDGFTRVELRNACSDQLTDDGFKDAWNECVQCGHFARLMRS